MIRVLMLWAVLIFGAGCGGIASADFPLKDLKAIEDSWIVYQSPRPAAASPKMKVVK